MSVESIKRLVQCEKEVKEKIDKACREGEEVRMQAKKDASSIIDELKRENEKKLSILQNEIEEYIKMIDARLKASMEAKIKELRNIKNRKEIVDALVGYVCFSKK